MKRKRIYKIRKLVYHDYYVEATNRLKAIEQSNRYKKKPDSIITNGDIMQVDTVNWNGNLKQFKHWWNHG